jgi:predicted RNA-binding protein with PUA-like domain
MVDLKALGPVPRPVTLKEIKQQKELADMALVRIGRLSVSPVTPDQWKLICEMGKVPATLAK